jgi:co-chaperonin GroES (HSP10)
MKGKLAADNLLEKASMKEEKTGGGIATAANASTKEQLQLYVQHCPGPSHSFID